MLEIKIVIYTFIFLSCSLIGILISKKYTNRVNELKEFKNALNIFKTKIRYTYEPIPDIFMQISENVNSNIGNVFSQAANKMNVLAAGEAWNIALKMEELSINQEDRSVLENLANAKLPYHAAFKKSGYLDINGKFIEPDEPNVYKFETFIFDAFSQYNDMTIMRVKREDEFAPVKNRTGNDSPETAVKLYNEKYK